MGGEAELTIHLLTGTFSISGERLVFHQKTFIHIFSSFI